MRYDADHKKRTHEQLLREAMRTLRKDGPSKLGVTSVMAKAGLTHGGFYAHFRSRDELLSAAIDRMLVELRDLFEKHTADKPADKALRSYIGFYLSQAHRDMRDAGCPLPALGSDLPRMNAPARRRFAAGEIWLSAGIQRLLEALGHKDAPTLASSVISEMVGALIMSRVATDQVRAEVILTRSRLAILSRLGLEE